MLVSNGPRRGEIAVLQWSGIDWARGVATINGSWNRFDKIAKDTKTVSGMGRLIWLPKQAIDALDALWHLQGCPKDGLVFQPKDGENIYGGMYGAYLRPVAKGAGLSREETRGVLHFHAMRHYAASRMDQYGLSRPATKQLLGHSRSAGGDVTSGYIHVLDRTQEQVVAQKIVDDLMPEVVTPISEAMKLRETGYRRWDPEKRRAYHREYMRKARQDPEFRRKEYERDKATRESARAMTKLRAKSELQTKRGHIADKSP
jgi:hypothetical protein